MGGGTMHIDLPKIQFNSTSSALPSVPSNNLNLSLPSNHASPLKPPSSSSCSCQNEICKKLEAVDGKETKTGTGSFNNFNLGPVPSESEVETALAALQNFIHGISSSRPEFEWLNSRELLSEGLDRVYDGFILLLTEPSIKRLVLSLSSDKAVWDAIMNNELVRKLHELPPHPAVESGRAGYFGAGLDGSDILQWIMGVAKAKVTELILKFQSVLNEVFQVGKRRKRNDQESRGQFEDEIRSSLFLSIVILLIVIVARVQRP